MEEITILLVDDEKLALVGFETGVDWKGVGITKVMKAYSKQGAISVLQQAPVDILLTDIEMPDGTGIELIRLQKENHPNIVSAFYTCHADFSYAQEAVKLGALDYLLKPVPIPELETILAKAVERVRRQREGERLAEILRPEESGSENAIAVVKKYIADNISLKIQREELAKIVYLNPDYLTKLFRKQMGVTLGEYILQKRLALAKQLLLNTNLSILDISERVGITDASYFIRTFKKQIGVTPQQYRESGEESRQ